MHVTSAFQPHFVPLYTTSNIMTELKAKMDLYVWSTHCIKQASRFHTGYFSLILCLEFCLQITDSLQFTTGNSPCNIIYFRVNFSPHTQNVFTASSFQPFNRTLSLYTLTSNIMTELKPKWTFSLVNPLYKASLQISYGYFCTES